MKRVFEVEVPEGWEEVDSETIMRWLTLDRPSVKVTDVTEEWESLWDEVSKRDIVLHEAGLT